ncbi:hypothetical protein L596_022457 [Steinernema carpocapsae]|uniref:Uncharacterized protein n=1 Tax=Steinernema carpocapsae TaxID=34508 RepID=A0A4U5MLR1_STECR|nr:hypothetical protein L596_022457 [Steinernema carpocapsae]
MICAIRGHRYPPCFSRIMTQNVFEMRSLGSTVGQTRRSPKTKFECALINSDLTFGGQKVGGNPQLSHFCSRRRPKSDYRFQKSCTPSRISHKALEAICMLEFKCFWLRMPRLRKSQERRQVRLRKPIADRG